MKIDRQRTILIASIAVFAVVIARFASPPAWSQGAGDPTLVMGPPTAAQAGVVTVPITFTGNGAQIASVLFAVNYDSALLAFDSTDANQDGVPDAVGMHLPAAFQPMISHDPANAGAELQVVLAAMKTPLPALPDGTLMEISFRALDAGADVRKAVRFGASPAPSLGNTSGQGVTVTVVDPSTIVPVSAAKDSTSPRNAVASVVIVLIIALAARRRRRRDGGEVAATPTAS